MNLDLDGRVVLVTGAGRGLGFAYAASLARHGALLAVHDGGVDEGGSESDSTVAKSAVEAIQLDGGTAFAIPEVISDAESCHRIVEATLEEFGRIDGLIHNAGLVVWKDPAQVDEKLYGKLSAVNNDAAFWLCSSALPAMREQGFGRIVLTTSGWALEPSPGSDELVLYSQGKGAQLGIAMALANGAGHPGILTNVISPVANTRMMRADISAGRFRPELVAGIVTWMASPACSFSGRIVRAGDGKISLTHLTDVGEVNLGDSASDPSVAAAALLKLDQVLTMQVE